ncbi:MAG: amidoligase family protein [Bacteroidales bacterium]|nr:amidoligase family protein [Bacteroidales bacterium]
MSITTEFANEIINDRSLRDKRHALIYIGIREPELSEYLSRAVPYDAQSRLLSDERTEIEVLQPQMVIELQPDEMLCDTSLQYTFGVEIECGVSLAKFSNKAKDLNFNGYRRQHYNHVDSREYFKFVSDSSVRVQYAAECVSPVLEGEEGLSRLQSLCGALKEAGAKVNSTCGLHVHIGAALFSAMHYLNVFVNYKHIERVIDTFMAESRRGNKNRYCRTLADKNLDAIAVTAADTVGDVAEKVGIVLENRYFKVNCEAFRVHGTIEFRQHQGTVDYAKISNWIKFLQQMVAWSEHYRLGRDVESIDELPFISRELKAFYKKRQQQLSIEKLATEN